MLRGLWYSAKPRVRWSSVITIHSVLLEIVTDVLLVMGEIEVHFAHSKIFSLPWVYSIILHAIVIYDLSLIHI